MSDGRLVTEYKNHCSRNIPTGQQFATKEWMTKHAEEIIDMGRERFTQQAGAQYGLDSSVIPPPAVRVNCTSSDCQRVTTGLAGGIGIEREGAAAPELFGTWDPRSSAAIAAPAQIQLTERYEGGRNTPRGAGMTPPFQMQ